MYNIPYFKEQDKAVVLQFMQVHPFAILIGAASSWPAATQVPLLIEERDDKLFLLGHFMRNTDHHKAIQQNNHVLCLFTGPHAYVSASWYTQPKQASTWNYMTVQAKGILSFTDKATLQNILHKTTMLFEGGEHTPAAYQQLSPEYIDKLINAIVGFEIEVTSIEHVFKLSQNRDAESYQNIITQLQTGDKDAMAIAEEMEKRQPH